MARGRPFSSDGGEQSIETIILAVVHKLGAAAGAIGVAGAIVDQWAQARIEELDLVAGERRLRKVLVDEGEEVRDVALADADIVGIAGESRVGRTQQGVSTPGQDEEMSVLRRHGQREI